uniref:Uncharacterized protein n=1 Tax=Anguilla anguilla TaxID=7936 RepID=A0A0E9V287_ANGAN
MQNYQQDFPFRKMCSVFCKIPEKLPRILVLSMVDVPVHILFLQLILLLHFPKVQRK